MATDIEKIKKIAEGACAKSEHTREMVLAIKSSMDTKIDRINANIENLKDNHLHTLSDDVQQFKVMVTKNFGDIKEQIATQIGEVKGQIKNTETKTGFNKDVIWFIGSQIVITGGVGSIIISILEKTH